MTKALTFVMLAAWAIASASPVDACAPPLTLAQGRGESDEAFRARREAFAVKQQAQILDGQQRVWNRAATVLVARVDKVGPTMGHAATGLRQAVLTPMSAAKGTLPAGRFMVEEAGMTACGPIGAGDATSARPGDMIAVYLLPGRPGSRTLLDAIARGSVLDPRGRLLLEAGEE